MPSSIAYLAPEIPARSATFVYQEINHLESKGYHVRIFSLRRPSDLAISEKHLLARTTYLYDGGVKSVFVRFLLSFFCVRLGVFGGLRYLISDIIDVKCIKTSFKLIYQFFASVYLAKSLLDNDVKHLHVHFAHVPTQVAMYASKISKVPFTVTSHANDIFERGLLLTVKAKRSKRFFTISNFNMHFLEGKGISAEKLAVVRCGVSLNYLKKTPNLLNIKDSLVIGTLGRLVEKKGVDVLLNAVALLKSQDFPFNLTVKVAGDGPLFEDFKNLVNQLDITKNVVFDGALNHEEVPNWLNELDVFVLACKEDSNGDKDGIPVVLMEAMSQSVPVISTNISGIPELVIDNETGFLAEPNSYSSLACKIDKLVQCGNNIEKITDKALYHVNQEFSLESNVNRLLTEFNIQN